MGFATVARAPGRCAVPAASMSKQKFTVSGLMINRACENYSRYFPAAFSIRLWNVPSGNLSMSNTALR